MKNGRDCPSLGLMFGERSWALAASRRAAREWRGSRTGFSFSILFFSVGIIITVSRTPFNLMPGELFSIGLFTAIIKCLWIVQRPIFKSLFLPFEGSGKSIKLEKLSYFSSGEEKQSRELLALKFCRGFPMNEILVCIIMSGEMEFLNGLNPLVTAAVAGFGATCLGFAFGR